MLNQIIIIGLILYRGSSENIIKNFYTTNTYVICICLGAVDLDDHNRFNYLMCASCLFLKPKYNDLMLHLIAEKTLEKKWKLIIIYAVAVRLVVKMSAVFLYLLLVSHKMENSSKRNEFLCKSNFLGKYTKFNFINQQYRYLFLTPVSLFIVSHFCTRASRFQYLCACRNELLYFLFSLAGVPKFILISVHDYNLPQFLLESGYFTGKRKAESEVLSKYPNSGNL